RVIEDYYSYLNYDLVNKNKVDFNEKIDEIIEQNYKGKRKIRTDAIKHIDGVITSDSEFFENKSPDDIRAFFRDAKDFLDKEYGESNLIYATVHMDVKTTNMHFVAV
ncbi:plasmid recombination protein, partial [Staphylococcus sp. GDX8P113P-1]|uniref:plasmid recombination protein n=1 Tax=Staphylococcus sp. GDX8P113P-1 TaxID=2804488 RepID=UPI0019500CD4